MQRCGKWQASITLGGMSEHNYRYIIVGGGLAGASAAEAIRNADTSGSILVLGAEGELPYHRPPLSKQLWSGKKKATEIFVHDRAFYAAGNIEMRGDVRATGLDAGRKAITDSRGEQYRYGKLLLATGGTPRRLNLPGADLEGMIYYRTLADFGHARAVASARKSAVVIGGGFIGSEMAASLRSIGMHVTMVFPGRALCERVFPGDLSQAMTEEYRKRGVEILSGDKPQEFGKDGARFWTRTAGGQRVESDLIIVGIGITPNMELAQLAGLNTGDGIIVNERLQTSNEHIYAAGDNAFFPCPVLGRSIRVEHWDNAKSSGECAGQNLAGADQPYDYVPYFFSDLFEFGYEAVGDVDARLETFADWQKEFDTGTVYYLKDGKVRGAMMCNIWGKVDAARQLVREGKVMGRQELAGAIR